MSKTKKTIQIKCVAKCHECKNEKCILSVFTHSRKLFPDISYKEFIYIADNNYDKFEQLVKNNCKFKCKCGSDLNIIEILDIQWINNDILYIVRTF